MFSSSRSASADEQSVDSTRKKRLLSRMACKSHADKNEEGRDDHTTASNSSSMGSFFGLSNTEEETETRDGGSKWNFFEKDDGQKKVVYEQFGDDPTAVLKVETTDDYPQPQRSTDVIIKVQASTVSLNDCVYRRGMCLELTSPISLPCTPGSDVVGVIVSVGSRVENDYGFVVGDRVAALIRTGGNARYANVPGASLVKVPKSVAADDAVCMVSTYMTAYQSHRLICPEDSSLSGKKVLVTGGTGPLGQAIIQFARRAGAKKVYTTAPSSRHMYVRMFLGATPLPLEPSEWLPLVEGSMDVVFDSACQDGYKSSQAALNDDGSLVAVGMYAVLQSESTGTFGAPVSAHWTKTKSSYFMSKTQSYDLWSSFCSDPEKFKSDLETLFVMLKKRDVKPHVVKRVGLSHVSHAQAYIENGKAAGAVVCMPWRRVQKTKTEDNADDDGANSASVSSWYSK